MLDTSIPEYQWVTSDESLQAVMIQCRELEWVALDTEFVRYNTYYPNIGLIQLAAGNRFYLIDPLTIQNKQPLIDLLDDPKVVKVMHACSEDLEVFRCYLGTLPQPLFDTQIAAALLGHGFSIGYKTLVEKQYGISLPKEQQRSNWCNRPLTEAQQKYAILDVVYLADIYEHQLAELHQVDRFHWLTEECQCLIDKQSRDMPADEQYLRIKGVNNLNGQQLYVVKKLAEWRENESQKRNTPRGFLLKDAILLELARKQPDTLRHLSTIAEIHPKTLRLDGANILELIKQFAGSGEELPVIQDALPISAKSQLKQMQKLVAQRADSIGIPPELMLNKKSLATILLEYLTSGKVIINNLQCWKKELIEKELSVLLGSFKVSNS